MNKWLVVGVKGGVALPTKEQQIPFDGETLVFRPETDRFSPSIVAQIAPSQPRAQTLSRVMRFLSGICWVFGRSVQPTMITGGSHPIQVGKMVGEVMAPCATDLHFDYVPSPQDQRTRRALAFYREAICQDNPFYKFFSFYKIINNSYPDGEKGKHQKQAIDRIAAILKNSNNLPNVQLPQQTSIGEYLYGNCRCGIAHAYLLNSSVDPDDATDMEEISLAVAPVRAIAEYIIRTELSVDSFDDFLRKHSYHIFGFKTLFGVAAFNELRKGGTPVLSPSPTVKVNVIVRDHAQLPSFENMTCQISISAPGIAKVRMVAPNNLIRLEFELNFPKEQMTFDPLLSTHVDISHETASPDVAVDYYTFLREMLLNGTIEFWASQEKTLLGRSDPYLPMNIMVSKLVEELDGRILRLRSPA